MCSLIRTSSSLFVAKILGSGVTTKPCESLLVDWGRRVGVFAKRFAGVFECLIPNRLLKGTYLILGEEFPQRALYIF